MSCNDKSCQYNTLGCYYSNNSTMPVLRPGTVSGAMVVPSYGAIGYNALTHGSVPSCGGHFNITNAYGQNSDACNTQYSTRLCSSCTQ